MASAASFLLSQFAWFASLPVMQSFFSGRE